jgi:hypothetical protein
VIVFQFDNTTLVNTMVETRRVTSFFILLSNRIELIMFTGDSQLNYTEYDNPTCYKSNKSCLKLQ